MNIWLDWPELSKILKQKKKVYLFGRSEDWVPKTLTKWNKYKIDIIILDNNPAYNNTTFLGYKVENPRVLKKFDYKQDYVIITAEPDTVIFELEKLKIIAENNFCCTPEIKEWGKLQELKKARDCSRVTARRAWREQPAYIKNDIYKKCLATKK